MSENEWMASDDLYHLLWFLKYKDTSRKMRLFICACCRRVWPELSDHRYYHAIEVSEKYVDGLATEAERDFAHRDAKNAMLDCLDQQMREPNWAIKGELIALSVADEVSAAMLTWLFNEKAQGMNPLGDSSDRILQADILRDIFGPLAFRTIEFNPCWTDAQVLSLANSIYNGHLFELMPMLADVLTKAGCKDNDIISHCQASCIHVRGCWALDMILQK